MPRIKLATSDLNLPFVLERRQFLVRLIYSMTINRADRLTLVKLEYTSQHQSCGRLYLALSRTRLLKTSALKYVRQEYRTGEAGSV